MIFVPFWLFGLVIGRDRTRQRELVQLRFVAAHINTALGDGTIRMVRLGSRIRRRLEKGLSGKEVYFHDDADLEEQDRVLERMPLSDLHHLYVSQLSHPLTQVDPSEDGDVAEAVVAGWIKSKVIAREASTASVRKAARELEDLYLMHVRNLLRIVRGESPAA